MYDLYRQLQRLIILISARLGKFASGDLYNLFRINFLNSFGISCCLDDAQSENVLENWILLWFFNLSPAVRSILTWQSRFS